MWIPVSDLRRAARDPPLAQDRAREGVFAVPHLVRDEVVAQSVQAAGDVGDAHADLDEKADAALGAAVLDHPLVHLISKKSFKGFIRINSLQTNTMLFLLKASVFLAPMGLNVLVRASVVLFSDLKPLSVELTKNCSRIAK